MPTTTTRPRHLVTETDEVAAGLDDAACRWPEDRDSRGSSCCISWQKGTARYVARQSVRTSGGSQRSSERSGALTGTYETDYLNKLRADWPA